MTKINSNENELSKALEFLQYCINNKSEFENKAIKALVIYKKSKNQIKYQQNNNDKVKIESKNIMTRKNDPEFMQNQRDKAKRNYEKEKNY